jgi:hypothetical protein
VYFGLKAPHWQWTIFFLIGFLELGLLYCIPEYLAGCKHSCTNCVREMEKYFAFYRGTWLISGLNNQHVPIQNFPGDRSFPRLSSRTRKRLQWNLFRCHVFCLLWLNFFSELNFSVAPSTKYWIQWIDPLDGVNAKNYSVRFCLLEISWKLLLKLFGLSESICAIVKTKRRAFNVNLNLTGVL